jgi:predicted Zn-dependent protease
VLGDRLRIGFPRPCCGWMALGFVALWVGCAQSTSVAGDCQHERARARNVARKISEEWPLRSADYVADLVQAVVGRLAAVEQQRSWKLVVFRSRNAEAYSIGDGRIYVSDGAVRACETESELAAILAHEMAHQILGHFCEAGGGGRGRSSVGSISLSIDPSKELAADRFGLDLMARGGYDPRAALSIVRRVQSGTPRGHLDEMGRVVRLEGLLARYSPREGYETEPFVATRQRLQAERGL